MRYFRKSISTTRLLLLAALVTATPAAASTFDGDWNVQIASSNEACSSGASVSLGDHQRSDRLEQRDGDGIGPRRRGRRHQRDIEQRPEASGGHRSPLGHVRLGYLARRAVFGHMDRATVLVPRHRGFDRLDVGLQDGYVLGRDEDLDAARDAGLASDEASAFEGEDHLVDGRRGHAEMSLDVGLGGRAAVHARVGIDKGQILALLGREAGAVRARHLIHC
jgi:hypothetical protein